MALRHLRLTITKDVLLTIDDSDVPAEAEGDVDEDGDGAGGLARRFYAAMALRVEEIDSLPAGVVSYEGEDEDLQCVLDRDTNEEV